MNTESTNTGDPRGKSYENSTYDTPIELESIAHTNYKLRFAAALVTILILIVLSIDMLLLTSRVAELENAYIASETQRLEESNEALAIQNNILEEELRMLLACRARLEEEAQERTARLAEIDSSSELLRLELSEDSATALKRVLKND